MHCIRPKCSWIDGKYNPWHTAEPAVERPTPESNWERILEKERGTQRELQHATKRIAELESELSSLRQQLSERTKDLEQGFMPGAYARLKQLQSTEERVEELKAALGDCVIVMAGLILGTTWELAPEVKQTMQEAHDRAMNALSTEDRA